MKNLDSGRGFFFDLYFHRSMIESMVQTHLGESLNNKSTPAVKTQITALPYVLR